MKGIHQFKVAMHWRVFDVSEHVNKPLYMRILYAWIVMCSIKSPTQICPVNEKKLNFIWIDVLCLDWMNLPLHYHPPHLWDPLDLVFSPGHLLLLCISSSSHSSSSCPSPIIPFFSPQLSTPRSLHLLSHQHSFILQIMIWRFTGNHMSADSFFVHSSSRRMELTSNIISSWLCTTITTFWPIGRLVYLRHNWTQLLLFCNL